MSEKQKYDTLVIGDAEYKTILTNKYKNKARYQHPKIGEITAFIPGTIQEIFVKVGDTVEAGQILLILEAMKMKNRLESPINGTIKELLVKQGNIVTKNQLLVVVK